MSEQPKGDGNNTDASRDDSSHGDVLAEKKRIARRQILIGTAAVGAVLGSTSRARAQGLSVCLSFIVFTGQLEDPENFMSPATLQGCAEAVDDVADD